MQKKEIKQVNLSELVGKVLINLSFNFQALGTASRKETAQAELLTLTLFVMLIIA